MKPNQTCKVFQIKGEIDLEDSLQLSTLISEELKKGITKIVLDLSKVDHLHVQGIPFLAERAYRLREYGGDMKLVGASEYLKNVIILTEFQQAFDYCKSEGDAIKKFENEIPSRILPLNFEALRYLNRASKFRIRIFHK